ncbi:17983_t:CDS:2 [Dentiscutata erythropus]|uniref:17983_t:CDS:1 n=1 Tax=Dentiscutata erythropus TaxID=1348616 RepID=A0A9N8YTD1_9GLOM|nr:17983_t:CDS:2 [Dentiscutata erythropus]
MNVSELMTTENDTFMNTSSHQENESSSIPNSAFSNLKLTLKERYKILKDIFIIHTGGFIHKDFHSGNIFKNDEICWLVDDFGLAIKQIFDLTGEILGIMPYVAFEIYLKKAIQKICY